MQKHTKMKDIKGYEGMYSVNEDGRVYSHKTNIWLLTQKQGGGYLTVGLHKNGTHKVCTVHRLVAIAFIPNPNALLTVNHKDMNKHNNCVENLEWCSYQDNLLHATKNGCHIGSRNGNSKLTAEHVLEIRSKYSRHINTHKMLAKEYSVGHNYIARILKGIVWKHV